MGEQKARSVRRPWWQWSWTVTVPLWAVVWCGFLIALGLTVAAVT